MLSPLPPPTHTNPLSPHKNKIYLKNEETNTKFKIRIKYVALIKMKINLAKVVRPPFYSPSACMLLCLFIALPPFPLEPRRTNAA